MMHGERIGFEEVEPLDFCVVGSVAVSREGGRTGKGAGFADLETGIFRELGIIGADDADGDHRAFLASWSTTPRCSCMAHDSPLDFVATEEELIVTGNTAAAAEGRRLGSRAGRPVRNHPVPARAARPHAGAQRSGRVAMEDVT